jgi:hypothetical protein
MKRLFAGKFTPEGRHNAGKSRELCERNAHAVPKTLYEILGA